MNVLTELPDWRDKSTRDDILVALVARGLSGGQIAASFRNATRSAVLGRLFRIQKRAPELRCKGKYHPPRHPPRRRVQAPAIVPEQEYGIRLMDLTATTCRWPVSGECEQTRFCGAWCDPLDAYCEGHTAIAYRRGE